MVPKMAPIRGNGGLNIRVYVRDPEKAHPCAESRVLAYFASKSVQGLSCSELQEPKKLPFRCAIWRAKSRMRRKETPGRIVTNFCTGVRVHDVITSANFYDSRVQGLNVVGGVKFWASPLTCIVALTTLSHYRASVWCSPYGMSRPLVGCLSACLSVVCGVVAPYAEGWTFRQYYCTI